MKHDTISLRRRHLMIAGLAGAAAPAITFGTQTNGVPLDARDAGRIAAFSAGEHKLVVSGRILRPDGAPLAGGTVEAWHVDADAAHASATTDADGRFMFTMTTTGKTSGRPQGIRYRVRHRGHDTPVTQLQFARSPGAPEGRVARLQRDDAGIWRASFGHSLA
jgi:protocatechuate 3,4-dioxygenase beta subunit